MYCEICCSFVVCETDLSFVFSSVREISVTGRWITYVHVFVYVQNNVAGTLCDECKPGFFHLSEANPEGCLRCFCMGVTKQCASSTWNRDQVGCQATNGKGRGEYFWYQSVFVHSCCISKSFQMLNGEI